ncbi:hypothetical protein B0T22DRAFT_452969 [Podospora appendiculata]|uniref:Uncharacterized protein n=1 Tax=Podospora appendiculata TaxID=314037 RepID=A0AAE0XJV5_9PEZI|nr:hypothetical protein B0T22DRAFT_452969 [Podospora appendiculata]
MTTTMMTTMAICRRGRLSWRLVSMSGAMRVVLCGCASGSMRAGWMLRGLTPRHQCAGVLCVLVGCCVSSLVIGEGWRRWSGLRACLILEMPEAVLLWVGWVFTLVSYR